jgi:hypothetical protein
LVFQSSVVDEFFSKLFTEQDYLPLLHKGFTVTTANPDESGGLGGIRITELETPGR